MPSPCMALIETGKKILEWTFVGATLTIVACFGTGIYFFRKMPNGIKPRPPKGQPDQETEENGDDQSTTMLILKNGRDSDFYSSISTSPSPKGSDSEDSNKDRDTGNKSPVVTFDIDMPSEMPRRIGRPKQARNVGGRRRSPIQERRRDTNRFVFSDTFTHEEGGELTKEGSDVKLIIPRGAVPKGKVYRVNGRIHTNLDDYSSMLEPGKEHIIGPIPEYEVECGGRFDKPVQVIIPHCMGLNSEKNVTVRYGTGEDLQEISPASEDVRYVVENDAIHIWTSHFTKFLVSANMCEGYDVTDALLTVAAQMKDLHTKSVIQIRVMIHSRCPDQPDFSLERTQFYDPCMVEIKRMKVDLPNRGSRPYPKIVSSLTIDKATGWKNRLINGKPIHSEIQEKDGQDVLSPRYSDTSHRSEQLADFSVEKSDKDDTPLSCSISVDFVYDGDLHKPHIIDVDYPIMTSTRRKSSVVGPPIDAFPSELDPLNEVFRAIAKRLGNDHRELAVHLGMAEHDRTEIDRRHQKTFDRNYEMLIRWRKTTSCSATIDDLLQALNECNRKDLEDIANTAYYMYSSPTGATTLRRKMSPAKTVHSHPKIHESDSSQDEE